MARNRTWLEWLNPMTRVQRWLSLFAFVWFSGAAFLLYRAFTRSGVEINALLAIYLLGTVTCSVIAFVLYGIDKRRATRNRPRISERTLHVLSALGGWPGAHLAQRMFHHKTLKLSFRAIFWLIVAVHFVIIVYGFLFGWWRSLIGW